MKLKKWFILLSLVLILSLLIPGYALADSFSILFTSWTEYPSTNSEVAANGYEADFTELNTRYNKGLYHDYGADYFDENFVVTFECYASAMDSEAQYLPFRMTNQYNKDFKGGAANDADDIAVVIRRYSPYLIMLYTRSSSPNQAGYHYMNISSPVGQHYYCRLSLDRSIGTYGTAYLDVYSDATMETLVGSISQALYSSVNYRYLFIPCAFQDNINNDHSTGYVKNVTYYGGESKPFGETLDTANVTYYAMSGFYNVNVSANITNAGTVAGCQVTFYYAEHESENWSIGAVSGLHQTGEIVDIDLMIDNENAGKEYDFYARFTNDWGDYSSPLVYQFTLATDETPEVMTLGYPQVWDSENLTVTVYGYVVYDGGDDCSGWFKYKKTEDEEWTTSSNTTGLNTGDNFTCTIPDIETRVEYEFQTFLENDNGVSEGQIGTFTMTVCTEATAAVNSATYITSQSATISATVTDDGDCDTYTQLQYKQVGSSTWVNCPAAYLETGESYSINLPGLTPSTQYEYRAWYGNLCTTYGDCEMKYTSTMTFMTSSAVGVPQLVLDEVGYNNDYSLYAIAHVIDFGGSDTVDVWFEYREKGSGTWLSNYDVIHTTCTEDKNEAMHYIPNVTYGHVYEVRAAGQNDQGIGYSTAGKFFFVSADDTTTPEPAEPVSGPIDRFLALIGMNNQGGHLLFIIVMMAAVFLTIVLIPPMSHKGKLVFAIVMSCLVFCFGVVIGYIPVALTIGVLVAAAGTLAVLGVRIVKGGQGA